MTKTVTKILTKTVTKQRERLKTLSLLMLRWAENNKRAVLRGERNVPIVWKKAFKYVTGLDIKLDMKYATALTKEEMSKCNKYYKEYR
jgi:hypothetical protein